MKSASSAAYPRTMRALAILCVVLPAAFIIYMHSAAAPDAVVARADTFLPGDAQFLFNDLTPSNRTGVLSLYNGVRVRPVTASPVYLLFQPRVHSKTIVVELTARANIATRNTMQIGYRTADGPQYNVLQSVDGVVDADGWVTWRATLPFASMLPELIDARRIVFAFSHQNGETWMVRSVRLRYE